MTDIIEITETKKYRFETPITWYKEEGTGDWIVDAPFHSFTKAEVMQASEEYHTEWFFKEDIDMMCDVYLPCIPETCTEGAMKIREKILSLGVSEKNKNWLHNLRYLSEEEKKQIKFAARHIHFGGKFPLFERRRRHD